MRDTLAATVARIRGEQQEPVPEQRMVRVTTSPGRSDGKTAGPVVQKPVAIEGKFQVAEMQDGTRYVVFADGSFRNVHNRRQTGLSGRQRRIIRKEENRRARRVAAVMHKIQARDEKTPQE